MNQSLYLQQDVLKRSLFRLPAPLLMRTATFILIGLIVELSITVELVFSDHAALAAVPSQVLSSNSPLKPSLLSRRASLARKSDTSGFKEASMAVDDARRYSRRHGLTSWDIET